KGGLRPRRRRRWKAGRPAHGHRERGASHRRGLREAEGRRDPCPRGEHAVLGDLQPAVGRVPRVRTSVVGDGAGRGGAGCDVRLARVGGPPRGDHRHDHLRCIGAHQGPPAALRLHHRARGGGGEGAARPKGGVRHAPDTERFQQGAVMNPLKALGEQGQSVWLDYMRRNLITTGELKKLIDNDGLKGLTSNPTIFQKAVEAGDDYDDLFREWAPKGASAGDVFETLAIRDIGDAAKTFRPVWEQTKHRDGYCSIEVTPTLAHDTQ